MLLKKSVWLVFVVILLITVFTDPAHAYIGPGAGFALLSSTCSVGICNPERPMRRELNSHSILRQGLQIPTEPKNLKFRFQAEAKAKPSP